MSNNFYENLKGTVDNVSITENGAVGYKRTEHALTDFNFKVASYRGNAKRAVEDFKRVLNEKESYVLKYLFYLRDAREGIGERDLFRVCISELLNSNIAKKDEVVSLIIKETPEFGRWDDLWLFLDTKYSAKVIDVIKNTLKADFAGYKANKSISLLAKWLPSANASSRDTKRLANLVIKALKTTPREYRKTLSTLRKYIDVVEVKTCSNDWEDIDYNNVPSKANLKYKDAFLKHDETRRRQYLNDLVRGVDKEGNKVKINSSVNFPHDILHMYTQGWNGIKSYDEAIEQLWKNLKEVPGLKDTIVVRDDSGSMESRISGSNVSALEIATALGIYCAEHNSEAYKNKIITFSHTPRYLDFSDERIFGSLHSKYKYLSEHSEVSNTNVEAVFNLILKTAVDNHLEAKDLPSQILIISDMEFDGCAYGGSFSNWGVGTRLNASLFNIIANRYAHYGYKLPKLIFWNVNSRTGTIPCKYNENGVLLVSGFSQNILKMVMNGKTDPYDSLIEELNNKRYESIPLVEYDGASIKKSTRKKEATPSFLK